MTNARDEKKNSKPFNKNSRNRSNNSRDDRGDKTFEEKVVQVDRVSRTVKGGKRMRFRALVIIGNRQGKVALGIGKAQEVLIAVQKAVSKAKKNIIEVPIVKETIPHEIKVKYGSARLILIPASIGTSVIAGGSVRTVLELAGVKNVLSKILGTSNKINNAKATILALQSFKIRENNHKDVSKKEENEIKHDEKTK